MNSLQIESNVLGESIVEQLNLLISTPVGTVVFDRDFGVDMRFIDMPINIAKTMAASELAAKIKQYIPSITLKELREEESRYQNGELILKVVVELV